MPIISSLGALTYPRSTEGGTILPWQYFSILVQNSNLSIDYFEPSTLFDSTDSLYLSYSTATPSADSPNILKIDISNVANTPTTTWIDGNFKYTNNQSLSSIPTSPGILLVNSPAGNLLAVQSQTARIGSSQSQYVETHTSLNKTTGNIITGSLNFPYLSNATSTSGEIRNRIPSDIVFDISGNYTVIGKINPRVISSNVTYDNNQSYITKYDGSTGNIIFQKNFGINSNVAYSGLTNRFGIDIDSGNNYRIAINTYANSKYNSVIANIDSTFSTINWQTSLSNGNTVLAVTDAVSFNDNSYVLLNDVANTANVTFLSKLDNSGTIVWSIKSNSNLYSSASKIIVDNGNILFTAFSTVADGNGTINQGHIFNANADTGVINWQRQLRFTGTNYYNYNPTNLTIENDLLSISGNIVQINKSNGSNQQYLVSSLVLPSDGGIPSDGSYALTGNITLTYSQSNIAFSNVTLTGSTSNNVIMNPLTSSFVNPATFTKTTPNITPTFSQLT